MRGLREQGWKKLVLELRHAEQFRHPLVCGATVDALALRCDTFGYQSLVVKSWEDICLSQYNPLDLEAWPRVCVLKHWRAKSTARTSRKSVASSVSAAVYLLEHQSTTLLFSIRCDALALLYELSIPLQNLVLALDVLEARPSLLNLLTLPSFSELLA